MIVGAGSDVGKSIMVTALCRIFRQEGIRVAPFKAQNMALNSFVTSDGGEIGRAQAVQAQAAGIPPHVDMNPILLKPTAGVGSQVIVHGKVYGNLTAKEYYAHRSRLLRKVMASFWRLSQTYELVVLEGAGSAVELNLKKTDLVNFRIARRVNAAVILVADIDRGGIFAATIGTFHLLTRAERRLLAGFIINKFRGDSSLFQEGIEIIEARTHRPVLGLVPYMSDLVIPQEDSVALDRRGLPRPWWGANGARIGVVWLPHISNYTDFDPLEHMQGVSLRYLDHRDPIEAADLLILPGTKNTIADLIYLKRTGLYRRIQEYASAGGRIIGICGGFQILGKVVRDPLGVEGVPREEEALGLLPVTTTMAGVKTTTQVEARAVGITGGGQIVKAYEIHMGTSEGMGPGRAAFEIYQRNGRQAHVLDGWVRPDGRIWGTYLHGIFDNDGFRQALLREIMQDRGISWGSSSHWSYDAFQEDQFDRLAELVRGHVDMDRIRALIQT
jgi:adenosylcobyric acid synthase